jgi:hypothetical protein
LVNLSGARLECSAKEEPRFLQLSKTTIHEDLIVFLNWILRDERR